jgi:hypothetical protein
VVASSGELITKVVWSVAAGGANNQTDAKQYRVNPATAVPEPATIVMSCSALMLSLGVVGICRRRRRRRSPVVPA